MKARASGEPAKAADEIPPGRARFGEGTMIAIHVEPLK